MARALRLWAALALALVLAVPAWAGGHARRRVVWPSAPGGPYTFTFVGAAYGLTDASGTPGVSTTTGTIDVQVGDLIFAAVQWEDNDGLGATIADNNGNNGMTLTAGDDVRHTGSGISLLPMWRIADTANATASFDATITGGTPSWKKITVVVYRPSGGTVSLDISGTRETIDTVDTNNPTTATFSTTGANDLVCAVAGIYTGGDWSNALVNAVAADHTTGLLNDGMLIWCDDDAAAMTGAIAEVDYTASRIWVATAFAWKAE